MTNALSLSSKMNQPELSIVIPFLNEERVLPLLRERLEKLTNRPATWELVFVSDGSTDGSAEIIEAWARADPSVKLIVLTRNFGHQSAISAGLFFAAGKCVGIMDADLQDEPEILLEMYQVLLAEKVDVVYAVRRSRHETKVKRFFYYVFYRLYLFLADSPVQLDSGDFCVMSRRAIQLLLSLPERLRFVRGLRAWLGLPRRPFPVSRAARAAGDPQYSFRKLLRLAFSGLTSFSTRPLRVGLLCGSLLCVGAIVAALIYAGLALFAGIHFAAPGFSTLVIILLFSNGLIFLYLGILGEVHGPDVLGSESAPVVHSRTHNKF